MCFLFFKLLNTNDYTNKTKAKETLLIDNLKFICISRDITLDWKTSTDKLIKAIDAKIDKNAILVQSTGALCLHMAENDPI